MRRTAVVAGFFAALLGASAALAADDSPTFGSVELVEGAVTIQAPDGSATTPKVGDTVATGSTVITGADGELHVATEDSGYVAVRPGTQFRVDHYIAEGGDDDLLSLSLLRGTFRVVTGWIGQFNRDNYRISTPTATIGVRGTDHEPSFVTEEDAARLGEEAGTYDKVNDGGSYIENAQGRTEIAPGKSGFVPHRPGLKPRLLEHVPRFYRATRNERRIVQRRAALRKIMARHRGLRRAIWLKRHAAGKAGAEAPRAKAAKRRKSRWQERREERK
jgi:hypothetical protein